MIVKILGVLDLLVATIFSVFYFFGFSEKLVMLAGFYLIAKGATFLMSKNIVSIIDIAIGIVLIVSINIHLPYVIAILPVLFLLQKGIFSFLS